MSRRLIVKPLIKTGGDKRDRTADLLHAMQALSQLSYTPLTKRNGDYTEARYQCKVEILNHLGKQAKRQFMRRSVSSRPSISSTTAIDGVCVSPVTMTRNGMANFGNLMLCAVTIFLISL